LIREYLVTRSTPLPDEWFPLILAQHGAVGETDTHSVAHRVD
jgi:hypothetical protein